MAEIVLGTGRHESVRQVMTVVERELAKTRGVPRKIIAKARNAEITALRPGFEGEFQQFTLRFHADGDGLRALKAAAAEAGEACRLTEENGWQVIVCPPAGTVPSGTTGNVVDALSKCVTLPEVWHVEGDQYRIDPVSVELLFQAMVQYRASDVHLSPGEPPLFRIDSQAHRSELLGALSATQILELIRQITDDSQWDEFQSAHQCSFNFHQVGLGYSRVSAFVKSGSPHLTFRFLPEVVPSFEELNIPRQTMVELANMHYGLVLITGMTGSGKTTTVATMVDWINSNKQLHILCIENPVEYVHQNKKSFVSQRSLGIDVRSFDEAVTGALRHDPDVLVIGEMRDADTIRSAINAAATGHLVISTLHSNTACEVINRIVSFFDPVERDLVRLQLRDCTRCVICQRLVPKIGGGRVPALEMLFNDIKPIANAIISGDTDGIRIGMQQTVSHSFLFEEYLLKLHRANKISLEMAQYYSTERTIFDQMYMGTYSVPRVESLKAARDASQRA